MRLITKKFSEINYQRPDLEAERHRILDIIHAWEKADSYEKANGLFQNYISCMERLDTMETVAEIRNTADMRDTFYEKETVYFSCEMPSFALLAKRIKELILQSPFRNAFARDYGDFFLQNIENDRRLESRAIIADQAEESGLCQEYSKTIALCTADFLGEPCGFSDLVKYMQSADRAKRRRAFEIWAEMYQDAAPKLNQLYDRLLACRIRISRQLGFDSFTDYIYLKKKRYDYTREDVAGFRGYVKKYITPVCETLYDRQRRRLGADRLHYYDESLLFPDGNAAPLGNAGQLMDRARVMYREMSRETGAFFDRLYDCELYDLEGRPGKYAGGYTSFLPAYKMPFVFANFNGTSADVDVLTHEAGHAFETYMASRHLPLFDMLWPSGEILEIHSMSMEFFAYPWMQLFFSDADRYRCCHLTEALRYIPYVVCVDEFQHEVYDCPAMTADERYALWRSIEKEYMPWRDYDGNDFLEKGGFWMQKQHIFLHPFYYIDYALAQICSFQYYIRMKTDRVGPGMITADCAAQGEVWGIRLCSEPVI